MVLELLNELKQRWKILQWREISTRLQCPSIQKVLCSLVSRSLEQEPQPQSL